MKHNKSRLNCENRNFKWRNKLFEHIRKVYYTETNLSCFKAFTVSNCKLIVYVLTLSYEIEKTEKSLRVTLNFFFS